MGRFEFDIPDDLFKELEDSFDDVAPKMIDAALPFIKKRWSNLSKNLYHLLRKRSRDKHLVCKILDGQKGKTV